MQSSYGNQMRKWAAQYTSYNPSTDVPSLTNWWRADTTINSGGTVSQLTDKKGSVNLIQATGTKQPALTSLDTLMGGRDSITWDGIDDTLIAASPGIGTMTAITIYMVVRNIITPGATGYLIAFGATSVAQSVAVQIFANGNVRTLYSNPGANSSSWQMTPVQHNAMATSVCILSWSGLIANGGSAVWDGRGRLGLQGSAITNASTGSTLANQIMSLGSSTNGTTSLSAFTLGELMICNTAHTSEQMLAVSMYLAGYYGVLN